MLDFLLAVRGFLFCCRRAIMLPTLMKIYLDADVIGIETSGAKAKAIFYHRLQLVFQKNQVISV